MAIGVLIVDDQEVLRAGLRTILESSPNLEVVADVGDALAALKVLDSVDGAVDVVLMDIRMPGIDGVEATSRIRARFGSAQVKVIILTTFEQDENVYAALAAGANGFLGKGVGPSELLASIAAVMDGGGALSASAAAAAINRVAQTPTKKIDDQSLLRFESLTAREREIVAAVTRGLSNEEIAAELFLSPFTVKTHANRAMAKVGARDRAQLVVLAFDAGIS